MAQNSNSYAIEITDNSGLVTWNLVNATITSNNSPSTADSSAQ